MDPQRPVVVAAPGTRVRGLAVADLSTAGDKGSALFRLPADWYPATLVIPTYVRSDVGSSPGLEGVLVESSQASDIDDAIGLLAGGSATRSLYVRSSAAGESIDERGKYESRTCPATLADVERTVSALWADLPSGVALGVLLQPYLRIERSGHLSNEYRVSRASDSWRLEYDSAVATPRSVSTRGVESAPHAPLLCSTPRQLESQLRAVARHFTRLATGRFHLEWVWDGSRLWIVQADPVPKLHGAAPGDAWQPVPGSPVAPESLLVWRQFDQVDTNEIRTWPKLQGPADFAECGLPTGRVWVLGGEAVVRLARSEDVDDVLADLEQVASGHIVIRTDVSGGDVKLMAPKSGVIADPHLALSFLRETATALDEQGVALERVCFIAHRFLRARASAWTSSRPNDPFVRVDSIWGTADGLAWLPHDSYWVDAKSGRIEWQVQPKVNFLDIDGSSAWTYRETPTEWIWRRSMTDDQLLSVATGAAKVADLLDKPVLTMWFVDMLDGSDDECLPWFRQFGDAEPVLPSAGSFPGGRIAIRTRADLESFDAAVVGGRGAAVLSVLPDPELVRDSAFVDSLAELAQRSGSAVELVGSTLAHPYYMLRDRGVTVSAVSDLPPPATEYNKLVRDNIVRVIESHGESAVAVQTSGDEFRDLLRAKLVEESYEVLRAATRDEIADEVADVAEVIAALLTSIETTAEEIGERREAKRVRRGGFDDGLFLVRTGRRESGPSDGLLDDVPPGRPVHTRGQVGIREGRLVLNLVPPAAGQPVRYSATLNGVTVEIVYGSQEVDLTLDAHTPPAVAETLF